MKETEVTPTIQAYGETQLADVETGKKVLEWLAHYYPNHAFFVECRHDAGVLTIQLLYRDKHNKIYCWNYGMLIHLKNLMSDGEIKRRAMLSGGELLERYRLARNGANAYSVVDAASTEIDVSHMVN